MKKAVYLIFAIIAAAGAIFFMDAWLDLGLRESLFPEKEARPGAEVKADTIEEADRLFEELRFKEAAAAYEKILESDPDNYGVLWRLARCYSKWGVVERENRSKYTPIAIDYAEKAVEADEGGFEGHLYLAESLGISLYYEGPRDKVRFIRRIKSEAQRAIEIAPEHYRPYMILGIWHRNVMEAGWLEKKLANIFLGGLPEASMEKAVKNLKKSAGLNPDFMKTHYELALAYKYLGEKELAVRELRKAVECPVTNIKEKGLKQKSRALLKKLGV